MCRPWSFWLPVRVSGSNASMVMIFARHCRISSYFLTSLFKAYMCSTSCGALPPVVTHLVVNILRSSVIWLFNRVLIVLRTCANSRSFLCLMIWDKCQSLNNEHILVQFSFIIFAQHGVSSWCFLISRQQLGCSLYQMVRHFSSWSVRRLLCTLYVSLVILIFHLYIIYFVPFMAFFFYLLFMFCYIIQHSGFIIHIFYGDRLFGGLTTQFSQEWARRKVVVKHSIKSNSSAFSKFTPVNWF